MTRRLNPRAIRKAKERLMDAFWQVDSYDGDDDPYSYRLGDTVEAYGPRWGE